MRSPTESSHQCCEVVPITGEKTEVQRSQVTHLRSKGHAQRLPHLVLVGQQCPVMADATPALRKDKVLWERPARGNHPVKGPVCGALSSRPPSRAVTACARVVGPPSCPAEASSKLFLLTSPPCLCPGGTSGSPGLGMGQQKWKSPPGEHP